jgi:hypothetical protein
MRHNRKTLVLSAFVKVDKKIDSNTPDTILLGILNNSENQAFIQKITDFYGLIQLRSHPNSVHQSQLS